MLRSLPRRTTLYSTRRATGRLAWAPANDHDHRVDGTADRADTRGLRAACPRVLLPVRRFLAYSQRQHFPGRKDAPGRRVRLLPADRALLVPASVRVVRA